MQSPIQYRKNKSTVTDDALRSPLPLTVSTNRRSISELNDYTATTTTTTSSSIGNSDSDSDSDRNTRGTKNDRFNISKNCNKIISQCQHRLPFVRTFRQQILRVPPRYRWAFVIFWFGWKILLVILMIIFAKEGTTMTKATITSSSTGLTATATTTTRILYIVTTLAEYNTGSRATTKGQDRLGEVLIPTLVDSVQTMVSSNQDNDGNSIGSSPENQQHLHVDVFLIAAYSLSPDREAMIRDALPNGVGLQIWDDAAPLGYELHHSPNKVIENTRALARQHRYVIKDKFPYYDLFLAFEDDMRISVDHVQHFLTMSSEINHLRSMAYSQDELQDTNDTQKMSNANSSMIIPAVDYPEHLDDFKKMKFYGQMTKEQLARIIPGFVRVEVLLNETANGAQTEVLPIERDYIFDEYPNQETHIDPRVCCHVNNMLTETGLPATPISSAAVIWETNIKAFSLRKLPQGSKILDWIVLMMGPGKRLDKRELLGGYWSGRKGAFGDEPRPSGGDPKLIAQQGGWMLTQDQIYRMHTGLCAGNFLPPFDKPDYNSDGQDSMNVEFWSGSYQIFTGVKGGCNMQRIMSMHPDHFSKHLLYHVANNKQRQLSRERMLRADHLFGQLHAVQKMAQVDMHDF